MAPLLTGVNVPYSDEFRSREANEALLAQLPLLEPKGGKPGKMLPPIDEFAEVQPLLEHNTFRHDLARAFSSQDIWFLVAMVAACLLFLDVFVRRVQINFAWVPVLVGVPEPSSSDASRKPPRSRPSIDCAAEKAEVAGKVDQLRATSRFEASEESTGEAPIDLAAPPAETPDTKTQKTLPGRPGNHGRRNLHFAPAQSQEESMEGQGQRMIPQSQLVIQNTKSETRNPKQTRMSPMNQ